MWGELIAMVVIFVIFVLIGISGSLIKGTISTGNREVDVGLGVSYYIALIIGLISAYFYSKTE